MDVDVDLNVKISPATVNDDEPIPNTKNILNRALKDVKILEQAPGVTATAHNENQKIALKVGKYILEHVTRQRS